MPQETHNIPQKNKYMLFTSWEVSIERNCARGLEYGLRRYSDQRHSFSQYGPT